MNKFFNKKHFKDDINEINKYIKETEDKLLEDSFHTLLNIEETNILFIKTNNTDKINKLEQDESYYFFQALLDDVLLSSRLIIKAVEIIANDKYMRQYLNNKIIISNKQYEIDRDIKLINSEFKNISKNKEFDAIACFKKINLLNGDSKILTEIFVNDTDKSNTKVYNYLENGSRCRYIIATNSEIVDTVNIDLSISILKFLHNDIMEFLSLYIHSSMYITGKNNIIKEIGMNRISTSVSSAYNDFFLSEKINKGREFEFNNALLILEASEILNDTILNTLKRTHENYSKILSSTLDEFNLISEIGNEINKYKSTLKVCDAIENKYGWKLNEREVKDYKTLMFNVLKNKYNERFFLNENKAKRDISLHVNEISLAARKSNEVSKAIKRTLEINKNKSAGIIISKDNNEITYSDSASKYIDKNFNIKKYIEIKELELEFKKSKLVKFIELNIDIKNQQKYSNFNFVIEHLKVINKLPFINSSEPFGLRYKNFKSDSIDGLYLSFENIIEIDYTKELGTNSNIANQYTHYINLNLEIKMKNKNILVKILRRDIQRKNDFINLEYGVKKYLIKDNELIARAGEIFFVLKHGDFKNISYKYLSEEITKNELFKEVEAIYEKSEYRIISAPFEYYNNFKYYDFKSQSIFELIDLYNYYDEMFYKKERTFNNFIFKSDKYKHEKEVNYNQEENKVPCFNLDFKDVNDRIKFKNNKIGTKQILKKELQKSKYLKSINNINSINNFNENNIEFINVMMRYGLLKNYNLKNLLFKISQTRNNNLLTEVVRYHDGSCDREIDFIVDYLYDNKSSNIERLKSIYGISDILNTKKNKYIFAQSVEKVMNNNFNNFNNFVKDSSFFYGVTPLNLVIDIIKKINIISQNFIENAITLIDIEKITREEKEIFLEYIAVKGIVTKTETIKKFIGQDTSLLLSFAKEFKRKNKFSNLETNIFVANIIVENITNKFVSLGNENDITYCMFDFTATDKMNIFGSDLIIECVLLRLKQTNAKLFNININKIENSIIDYLKKSDLKNAKDLEFLKSNNVFFRLMDKYKEESFINRIIEKDKNIYNKLEILTLEQREKICQIAKSNNEIKNIIKFINNKISVENILFFITKNYNEEEYLKLINNSQNKILLETYNKKNKNTIEKSQLKKNLNDILDNTFVINNHVLKGSLVEICEILNKNVSALKGIIVDGVKIDDAEKRILIDRKKNIILDIISREVKLEEDEQAQNAIKNSIVKPLLKLVKSSTKENFTGHKTHTK